MHRGTVGDTGGDGCLHTQERGLRGPSPATPGLRPQPPRQGPCLGCLCSSPSRDGWSFKASDPTPTRCRPGMWGQSRAGGRGPPARAAAGEGSAGSSWPEGGQTDTATDHGEPLPTRTAERQRSPDTLLASRAGPGDRRWLTWSPRNQRHLGQVLPPGADGCSTQSVGPWGAGEGAAIGGTLNVPHSAELTGDVQGAGRQPSALGRSAGRGSREMTEHQAGRTGESGRPRAVHSADGPSKQEAK